MWHWVVFTGGASAVMNGGTAADGEAAGGAEGTQPELGEGAGEEGARKGLTLTYEEYKQMANLLVCHMRREEELMEGEGRGEEGRGGEGGGGEGWEGRGGLDLSFRFLNLCRYAVVLVSGCRAFLCESLIIAVSTIILWWCSELLYAAPMLVLRIAP